MGVNYLFEIPDGLGCEGFGFGFITGRVRGVGMGRFKICIV